jgi:hypothetical protein
MYIKRLIWGALAAVGVMALSINSAKAVTLTTPQYLPTDTSFAVNISGGSGGQANISFDLLGWASLDGVNYYEDDFMLSLNSIEIFKGSFSLGGGGSNRIFNNVFGLTVAGLQPDIVTWAGGDLLISGLINLVAGNNQLSFSYNALGAGHAGFQGTGDEAWGVNNLKVSTVPVPPAAILMATGLFALSASRRKSQPTKQS